MLGRTARTCRLGFPYVESGYGIKESSSLPKIISTKSEEPRGRRSNSICSVTQPLKQWHKADTAKTSNGCRVSYLV